MILGENKRNEIDDLKNGLALSNSQSNMPYVAHEIKISIDRLTIVGHVRLDDFEILIRKWLTLPFIQPCGSGYQVLDYSNCKVDDFGNPHDEVPPEQVAFFEMVRFRRDTIRIDFNPNHSMHSPAGQWLLKEVIAKIEEKHFSRCDIAFDVYNFPQIQYYQVWKWGMTKKFFYGKNGQIQTVYFGARASERQIRLYNKKLEQEKRHGKIINIDSLWRLEMQLRGSKIDNYVDEVRDMLEHFYLPEWESEPTIQRQMIVYALINNPSFYGKASPRTKARYRDMIRECKGSNAISQEMARQFARDIKMLEGTLQEMLQRFHVRF